MSRWYVQARRVKAPMSAAEKTRRARVLRAMKKGASWLVDATEIVPACWDLAEYCNPSQATVIDVLNGRQFKAVR